MLKLLSFLFVVNFVRVQNYAIPNIIDEACLQTVETNTKSTVETTIETNLSGYSPAMGMQSMVDEAMETAQDMQLQFTRDLDTPIENIVETAQESTMQAIDSISDMANMQTTAEIVENMAEMTSAVIPSTMNTYLTEQEIMENMIERPMSIAPLEYSTNIGSTAMSTMQDIATLGSPTKIPLNGMIPNLPPGMTNMKDMTLSSVMENMPTYPSNMILESMSNYPPNMMKYPYNMLDMAELESQINMNEYSPLMGTMPNMVESVPGMMPTMAELESQVDYNTYSPIMETMPNMKGMMPLMPPGMGMYENIENLQDMQTLQNMYSNSPIGNTLNRIPFMNKITGSLNKLPMMNRRRRPRKQPSALSMGNQRYSNGMLSALSPYASMNSNMEASSLGELINEDSYLLDDEKNEFLQQLSNLGRAKLGLIGSMYNMLSSGYNYLHDRKMELIYGARDELMKAIQAMTNSDLGGMREHFMSVISTLQNSPIAAALRYALDQDIDMLPLVANYSRLILDKMF